MLESEIRANFAKNVRDLRNDRKLNQVQLGEKLSYSSKAVSKWENGDVTLKMIADFFEISVDSLISNKNVVRRSHRRRNRLLTTIVSALLTFFIAGIVFLILSLVGFASAWKAFIIAIPCSAVVLIVFSALWYKRRHIMMSTIYLILSSALMTIIIMNFHWSWWIITLLAVFLSVMSLIFFPIVLHNKE